jgi:hypothetical protein
MLNVDPAGIHAPEVLRELFVRGWVLKWVFRDYLKKFLNPIG